MDASAQVPARPGPVAGLPPIDPAGVARAWLLGLIAGRPLERAPEVPVGAFAGQAPAICAAVAAAVGDDDVLAALGQHGAAVAEIAGPGGPHEAVAAIEALRLALQAALGEPAAADRLAHCCAVLASAAAVPPVPDPEAVAAQHLAALEAPAAVIAVEVEGEAPDAAPQAPGAHVVAVAPGRWFVVTPAHGSRALAERLAAELGAVAGLAIRRGAEDPQELVALADERLFAARAAGVPVV